MQPDEAQAISRITKNDILHGLHCLGVPLGSGLIVHSSLKSFGFVEGGALSVIEALMEAVTDQGTIVMPSFNHATIFEPGGPGIFDPHQTPTINGAIPDLFWRLPGVHRSLNPTHAFAAWGRHAQRYTQNHHRTLTMGKDSPLGMLWQDGGYGLLLGVDYAANTFHHVVETVSGAPCLGQRTEAYPVKLPDGRITIGHTWGWREKSCPINDHIRYQDEMVKRGFQRETRIGTCRSILFPLQSCYDVVSRLLTDGLDPYPPCACCPIRPRRTPHTVASDWDPISQRPLPDSAAWQY
jgi:aminoglycoside N3'-acetyltransferase